MITHGGKYEFGVWVWQWKRAAAVCIEASPVCIETSPVCIEASRPFALRRCVFIESWSRQRGTRGFAYYARRGFAHSLIDKGTRGSALCPSTIRRRAGEA